MTIQELEKVLQQKERWTATMKKWHRKQKNYTEAKKYEQRQFELLQVLHALRSDENFENYKEHVSGLYEDSIAIEKKI